jgi:prepilin-type N-terminal cleavage/methylation domain-containing protein
MRSVRWWRRPGRKGFTLVELMVAVAIIAVLASLAIVAYGRQTRKSRLVQLRAFMTEIGAKMEVYESFAGEYLPPIADAFCPPNVGTTAVPFNVGACQNALQWQTIGLNPAQPTYFQFQILAGGPGQPDCSAPSATLLTTIEVCGSIDNNTHWWVIVARADQNGNRRFAEFVTSSTMGGRVYSRNETE